MKVHKYLIESDLIVIYKYLLVLQYSFNERYISICIPIDKRSILLLDTAGYIHTKRIN